jgi:hypothetical protein
MKSVQITLFCAAFVALTFFTGCAQPPTDEMNTAIETVTRAENEIDAVTYGANSLARAREALTRMQAAADNKNYDSARNAAEEATAAAQRAIEEGRAAAARARDEARSLVSGLEPLITDTEQRLNAAKAARLPLDFNSLDHQFDFAKEDAEFAREALSSGRPNDAIEFSRSTRSGLQRINDALSGTVTATIRSKK